NGGTLGGTGTLASVNINNNSTLAPGTIGGPPGTLHINGSLTFSSAATYLVQVTPAAASNTVVTGTASLNNATVQVVFAPGSLQKSYDILSSGGLGGSKFGTLQTMNLPPMLTASLSYSGTDVFLNLTGGGGGGGGGTTSTAGFSINQLN